MIKIKTESKLQSDSGNDIVTVNIESEGTRGAIVREIASILGTLEERMPELLHEAIVLRMIVDNESEVEDEED